VTSPLDQADHAGGQPDIGDGREVRPQAHGPDADHVLGGRRGAHLRGPRRDEPEPVVPAARALLQAELQLHLLEPLQVGVACGDHRSTIYNHFIETVCQRTETEHVIYIIP